MSNVTRESDSYEQHVHFTRGASYLIIQTMGISAVSIVSFVILARLITPKEMGIWAVLSLVNATCQAFVTLFPQAVTKYVAENIRDKSGMATPIFYQAFRTTFIMYLPVIAIIYFGATFLASHLLGSVSYAPLFQILAPDAFFFAGALPTVTAVLLGLKMFRETATVGLVINGFLRQGLIISLVVITKSLIGLTLGWLISDVATTIVYLALVIRILGAPRFDFPLSKLVHYSIPLELGGITSYAQSWFDRALLIFFVPLAMLGVYNAALVAYLALNGASYSITNMLLPAFSSIAARRGSVREAVRLAVRYSSLTLTPLAFCLFALAKPALALFVGPLYVGGSLPLMIFCAALAITAFTTPLAPLLMALEETKVIAAITAGVVLLGLAVSYLLLPPFGILGAATGRALTIISGDMLMLLILRRKMTLQLDLPLVSKTLVAGVTMSAVLSAVQLLYYSKFMLPIYVLIGGIVYLVMLRLLKTINKADIDLLQRVLGKRLSPIGKIAGRIMSSS